MWRDVPPTAGLPITWADLLHPMRAPDLGRALASFLGVDAAGVTCSGTAALIVAFEALRSMSSRRTVVIPAYTCPLVPLAVAHAGLHVRLCDLVPDRYDLDPTSLRAACGEDTLAIVATHLGGLPTDLAPVVEIARRCGAFVIEDAAQALGATWHGRPAGTVGDVGVYSLSRGKGLTVYEGGFWVGRNDEMRAAMSRVSDRLMPHRLGIEMLRVAQLIGYRVFYNPVGLRLVYGVPLRRALARGDYLRAVGDEPRSTIPLHRIGRWRRSVGASALRRLPAAIAASALRARRRADMLRRIPRIAVVDELPGTSGTWPFLTVLADSPAVRDRALHALWSAGVGITRLFIHDLTGYGYLHDVVPRTAMPHARSLAARAFTISNSEHLSDAEFERVHTIIARTAAA